MHLLITHKADIKIKLQFLKKLRPVNSRGF